MIYIDIDGTLADFVSAAFAAHGRELDLTAWPYREHDLATVLGLRSEAEFWKPIDKLGEAFWADLLPYGHFDEVLTLAERFGPWKLLSSPRCTPAGYGGRMAWIRDLLGTEFRDFVLTPDKTSVNPGMGDILIDDSDDVCDAFVNAGGWAIRFSQPWNLAWDDGPMDMMLLEDRLRECSKIGVR